MAAHATPCYAILCGGVSKSRHNLWARLFPGRLPCRFSVGESVVALGVVLIGGAVSLFVVIRKFNNLI